MVFTLKQASKIIGDFCGRGNVEPESRRKKAKYILFDRGDAWASNVHCKKECDRYIDCTPRTYRIIPLTEELIVALKLCFKTMTDLDNREPEIRQQEVKKFVKEWIRK